MNLTEIMDGVKVRSWDGPQQAEVSSLAYDARRVSPGSVFCTWKGLQRDGHAFVPDAIQRGAVAVVAEKRLADLSVPNIRVESGRRALGRMAANFYGHPSRHLQSKRAACGVVFSVRSRMIPAKVALPRSTPHRRRSICSSFSRRCAGTAAGPLPLRSAHTPSRRVGRRVSISPGRFSPTLAGTTLTIT
ncbi:MAG: hypothetical protein RL549_1450 [Verrucomicrobiota bacterium]